MIEKLRFLIGLYFCMLIAWIARIWFMLMPKTKSEKVVKIAFLENQTKEHAGAYYRAEILKEYFPLDQCEIMVFYPFSKEDFNADFSLTLMLKYIKLKLRQIILTKNHDLVIVRRELLHQCQYGSFVFEKLLLAIHPNAILDMDDYMPDLRKGVNSFSLFNVLAFYQGNKTRLAIPLFKYHTLATPEFKQSMLEEFSGIKDEDIHVFPMCLNYPKEKRKVYDAKNKSIGWVSRKIHFNRIDNLTEEFNKAYKEYPFELIIVADEPYKNTKLLAPIVNKKWSLEQEVDQILSFDIGIAPIYVEPQFKNRKGTFKLVQYMSLGVISITTDLAYSQRLIKNGKNGFLVEDNRNWGEMMKRVLKKTPQEMNEIAEEAYNTFYKEHHINSQASSLFKFYKKAIED